jgi:membrane-associated phospholipid phosphatase
MLLWAGLIAIALGTAALAIDRRLAHFIYDHVSARQHRALDSITHAAKAGHWLAVSLLVLAVAFFSQHLGDTGEGMALLVRCSLAFLASLTLGSVILHAIKLVLGRRRPRDDLEMGLYGFVPFAFNLDFNSFPSGHSLTIMIVATIASCVWPVLWPLWYVIAIALAGTRALLTAHFLSDVLIGAGIGLLSVRAALMLLFPGFAPGWI